MKVKKYFGFQFVNFVVPLKRVTISAVEKMHILPFFLGKKRLFPIFEVEEVGWLPLKDNHGKLSTHGECSESSECYVQFRNILRIKRYENIKEFMLTVPRMLYLNSMNIKEHLRYGLHLFLGFLFKCVEVVFSLLKLSYFFRVHFYKYCVMYSVAL